MLLSENYAIIFLFCISRTMAGNNRDWWKSTTIYEIFVRSFKDSNGDGVGDIKGITSMLDHFVDLKIETIWLTPIYESPMLDAGYDVSDYYNVDPRFGTMEDFDELITETKKRGLKLAMDFVLNHSSDKHPWFSKSVDRIEPYTDYFVWKDAKGYDKNGTAIPPNNWRSIMGGLAWKWNTKRKQFYYHIFTEHQVDYDLRNPNLLTESRNIIKFWFDKGVAAGRLDAPLCYVEDSLFRDEDYSIDRSFPKVDWPDSYYKYTLNHRESYHFVHQLREFVDSRYNSKDDLEKILFSESYASWNHTMKYYGTKSYKISHFPLNFRFIYSSNFESPRKLDENIKNWLSKMPSHGVANWQVENHDVYRLASKLNPEIGDIMLIITMTLPGIACIYYGQEIGLMNANLRSDQIRDILTRDFGRTPMQWDDSINAGFSSNLKPWLPVNPNYWQLNVQVQKKNRNSRYNLFKSLSKLRQTPVLKYGNFTSYLVSSWVYAFKRSTSSSKDRSVIVVANMGSETEVVHLHTSIPNLPSYLKVLAASSNSGYITGTVLAIMLLSGNCAILFFICISRTMAGNSRDWWKYTTIYEIFVRSFKDSNGDGVGDIKGIISMLDHFVDLKIEMIWLTPIYESPMLDSGYDVSDYYNVDPRFGTMEDFDELMTETKKRGLKLAMDFILNHSSDKHPWFLKSVDRIEPYTNYYVWKDAKGYDKNGTAIPPNNWKSIEGRSAWKWNTKRKQFYYHLFWEHQIDYDLRNPNLLKESRNIIKFWFDKGVAAGRLDATHCYVEDFLLRDEDYPVDCWSISWVDWPDSCHKYTMNQWESYQFIHELREFVDSRYNSKGDVEKILFAEAYTSWNHTMKYYGTKSYKIAHFPLNFRFIFQSNFESPRKLDENIKNWFHKMPSDGVANWQVCDLDLIEDLAGRTEVENHDQSRVASKLSPEIGDIMLIIIMTLPGVACIYYGQEIGLMNANLRSDQIRDVFNRDRERTPMQWDDSINAGFSSNLKPWLPVNPNYWQLNVQVQKKNRNSRYNLYKSLSELRQLPTLKYGNFTSYLVSSWVYAFKRSTSSSKDRSVIVVANMGSETEVVHLHTSIPNLPSYLKVLAASSNSGYSTGTKIYTNRKFPSYFIMRPSSAVVLST